jgi:hypothetical protein
MREHQALIAVFNQIIPEPAADFRKIRAPRIDTALSVSG